MFSYKKYLLFLVTAFVPLGLLGFKVENTIQFNNKVPAYLKSLANTVQSIKSATDVPALVESLKAFEGPDFVGNYAGLNSVEFKNLKSPFKDAHKQLISALNKMVEAIGGMTANAELSKGVRDVAAFWTSDFFVQKFAKSKDAKTKAFFDPFDQVSAKLIALADKFDGGTTAKPRAMEELEAKIAEVLKGTAALSAELEQKSAENEKLKKDLESAEQTKEQKSIWQKITGANTKSIKELKQEIADSTEKIKKLQEEADKAATMSEAKQKKAIDEIETKLAQATKENETVAAKLAETSKEIADLKAKLAGKEVEIVDLKKALAAAEEKIKQMEAANKKAVDDFGSDIATTQNKVEAKEVEPSVSEQLAANDAKTDLSAQAKVDAPTKQVADDAASDAKKLADFVADLTKNKEYDQVILLQDIAARLLISSLTTISQFESVFNMQAEIDLVSEDAKYELAELKQYEQADLFIPFAADTQIQEKVKLFKENINSNVTELQRKDPATPMGLVRARQLLKESITLYADIIKTVGGQIKTYIENNSKNVLSSTVDTSALVTAQIDAALKSGSKLDDGISVSWKNEAKNADKFINGTQQACEAYTTAVKAAFDKYSKDTKEVIQKYSEAVDLIYGITTFAADLNVIEKVFTSETKRNWLTLGLAKYEDYKFTEEYNTLNKYLKNSLINLADACMKQRAVNAVIASLDVQKVETASFEELVAIVEGACTEKPTMDSTRQKFTSLKVQIGGDPKTDVVEINAKTSQAALDAINAALDKKRSAVAESQVGPLVDSLVKKTEFANKRLDWYPIGDNRKTALTEDEVAAAKKSIQGYSGVMYKAFDYLNEDDKQEEYRLNIDYADHCLTLCRAIKSLYTVKFAGKDIPLVDYLNNKDLTTEASKLKSKYANDQTLLTSLKELDSIDDLGFKVSNLSVIASAYAYLAIAYKTIVAAEKILQNKGWFGRTSIPADLKAAEDEANKVLTDAVAAIIKVFPKFGKRTAAGLISSSKLESPNIDEAYISDAVALGDLGADVAGREDIEDIAFEAFKKIRDGEFGPEGKKKTFQAWADSKVKEDLGKQTEEPKPEDQPKPPAGDDKFAAAKTAFEAIDTADLKNTVLKAAAAFDAAGKLETTQKEELSKIWDTKIADKTVRPDFTPEDLVEMKKLFDGGLSDANSLSDWVNPKI